ncbi:MAG: FAD-binding protein [Arcobacter sp.]|mgnify:CR=1 FL=1|nr:FAD-binding protein [Arcobacter sp.]|tara:strand:- start:20971 stop:21192 length:222 start_codon:yes stop_codon:yes gene_type:complete
MKTITDYNLLLPSDMLFSIRQIDEIKLIKEAMLKKLIYNREIEVVKIGKKNFISRLSLIAYLEANTIPLETNK